MTYEHLSVAVRDRIATVTLDRPPANAVNQAMYAEIRDVFSTVDDRLPDVSVIVVAAAGKHFCAGNDLDEFLTMAPENAASRMRAVREAFAAIQECPVPTVAAVHGAALGTGMVIAACCDVVVCAESAFFGAPEVGVGVMGGAAHLARLVPHGVARLMYLTAEPRSAAELVPYGGIAEVVPDAELEAAARRVASRIARHSGVVLRHAKEALNAIEFMELKAGYELEQRLTVRLTGSTDARAALEAVRDRTEPGYLHRWQDRG